MKVKTILAAVVGLLISGIVSEDYPSAAIVIAVLSFGVLVLALMMEEDARKPR